MHHERDKRTVRSVGLISLLLGTVIMPVTIIGVLYNVLVTAGRGDVIGGAIAFGISLVMASTLLSCGTQLARPGLYTGIGTDIDTMRLCWAALLVVMVGGGVLAYYYIQPLALVAVFVAILLLISRGAVIRLSR
jgi:hypothetical protein